MACLTTMSSSTFTRASRPQPALRMGSTTQRPSGFAPRPSNLRRAIIVNSASPEERTSQETSSSSSPTAPLEQLKQRGQAIFQRYDFVSAGLGALAVTMFCVARGQDPATALWITAASTVVALLVNDFMEEH